MFLWFLLFPNTVKSASCIQDTDHDMPVKQGHCGLLEAKCLLLFLLTAEPEKRRIK